MRSTVLAIIKSLMARTLSIRCKRKDRAMQLCETLSLGDRRFLALVRVGEQKFLVGTAGNSISMLAQLSSPQERESHLRQDEEDLSLSIRECSTWK